MRRPLAFLISGVAAVSLGWPPSAAVRGAAPAPNIARPRADSAHLLWMEMRNVDLHIDPRNAMRIRSLRGQVVPTTPGIIAWLDQPPSFHIRATSGEVALDGEAITALLNEVAFNYPGAPIRNLRVTIENGSIVQRGTLRKGVDIPFQIWSVPVLQPDGRLKLHPDRMKIFGVNGTAVGSMMFRSSHDCVLFWTSYDSLFAGVHDMRTRRMSSPAYFERSIQSTMPPVERTTPSRAVGFASPARG